jgi:predicted transcriptional regulator
MRFKSGIDVEYLRRVCHNLYITPNQLNKIAGFSPGYLSRFYGGNGKPQPSASTQTIDRLATTLADLMRKNNQPVPDDLWHRLVEVQYIPE